MKQVSELKKKFRALYDGSARIFRAPGRVNLIGEHTDYNDGFVLPAAIGFYTWVAIGPRRDRKLTVYSENFSESVEFDLDEVHPISKHWSNYVRGVAVMLEQAGYPLQGAKLLIQGEVPIGAGLSSSAALEVAVAYALTAIHGQHIDRMDLARLCRRAESEFVGMRCGIMDQFVSCFAAEGKALMLDCRSLTYRSFPLVEDLRLVICNTGIKHELANSEYNLRRSQCEEGVRQLAERLDNVSALRDVNLEDLEKHGPDLPPEICKRCHHVIAENMRVNAAAAALEGQDFFTFGRLMRESHRSLRDDYEVSCRELDLMVELAAKIEGVYGARMTGAGFGGCTINLVQVDQAEEFKRKVAHSYHEATGIAPQIYICSAAGGVEEVLA